MKNELIPTFSVQELNQAIGNLLDRGFAPRFFLNGLVSKAQCKNGHLWLTITDGEASISAVIWSSSLKTFDFRPTQEDGVQILGKLNFWKNRATLIVQVINIRPTLSTVFRKFEIVRTLFEKEGLIDESKRKRLPKFPKAIAICTSVPSSAYADILRTAKERWPLTKLIVFPIPVQGAASEKIESVISMLSNIYNDYQIQALIIARGGGSREDLIVFDDEGLCRKLVNFPIPVVTGIGHEDDLTIADLVADHRAATPTAAIVDLLPSKEMEKNNLLQIKQRSNDFFHWIIQNKYQLIADRRNIFLDNSPLIFLRKQKQLLMHRKNMINAFSPEKLLIKGFCIARDHLNNSVRSVKNVKKNDKIMIELLDGMLETRVINSQNK